MDILKNVDGFVWDKGNIDKNWHKHNVSNSEAEEVFFAEDKKILKDIIHSDTEQRYILIGSTKNKRKLFIVFAIRLNKIRIISARDLNKREEHLL